MTIIASKFNRKMFQLLHGAVALMVLGACGGGSEAMHSEHGANGHAGDEHANHTDEHADHHAADADAKTIVETAIGAGQFGTLVAAVKAAGLVETLSGPGPFTVFAPTDEAFAKIDKATLDSLLLPENKDKLTAILTYHVVPGDVRAAQVVGLDSATTVEGNDVSIKTEGDAVMVNNASVVATDIACSNGVIHVIDTVLMPPAE